MARTTRDDGAVLLFDELRIVCEALRELEKDIGVPAIPRIRARAERALKKHSEPGYSAAVSQLPLSEPSGNAPRPLPTRKRELDRARLFALCTPEVILAPVNIVAVYLHEQPMWNSWDWPETAAVNARMWPFVQRLDINDPLPDDPRLALPLTVAGFMLYRALHVDPEGMPRDHPNVVMDVYAEIAQGIAILDKRLIRAAQQQIDGDVSQAFLGDLAHTTNVAETLLLHAVRLGPEMWSLILRCGLGTDCRLGKPYFVSRPGERSPHGRCRTALARRKARPVTSKPRAQKK